MDNLAGTFTFGNGAPVNLVRDGQDIVVMSGDKQLGYARHWRDARRGKSGFVATANLMPPPEGGAAGVDREVKKLRDGLAFIASEGVAL